MMIDYYSAESTVDYAPRPARRHAELYLKTECAALDTIEPKRFVCNEPLVELCYERDGTILTLHDAVVEKINYKVLHDKYLNHRNTQNTVQNDIRIESIEITSSTHGYDKIKPCMLRYKAPRKYKPLQVIPELSILSELQEGSIIQQSIETEWKDFILLDDPALTNRGSYLIRSFGYHSAANDILTVDSVALYEMHRHVTIVSNFREPLQIGHIYSCSK